MSTLKEDLIQDFRKQKILIHEQLAIFDPLGTQLRTPAAKRLVSKGMLILSEVLCYLLTLGAVALAVFLPKIHPFYILSELSVKQQYEGLGKSNIELLNIGIYALIGLIALLFFGLARAVRIIRLKNDILNFAGKHINTLVGENLKRKAIIETIEQRHSTELPVMPYTNMSSYEGVQVNEVPNPGFGE